MNVFLLLLLCIEFVQVHAHEKGVKWGGVAWRLVLVRTLERLQGEGWGGLQNMGLM